MLILTKNSRLSSKGYLFELGRPPVANADSTNLILVYPLSRRENSSLSAYLAVANWLERFDPSIRGSITRT